MVLLTFAFTSDVSAKKLLPRAKPTNAVGNQSNAGKNTQSSQGATAKVKFRSDRKAIVATFTNLKVAKNVSYTLTYESRGTTQGAAGSVSATESEPVVRELIFGTCSHGVCRYDNGITNARLVVTTTLKNGKKVIKSFKLKV